MVEGSKLVGVDRWSLEDMGGNTGRGRTKDSKLTWEISQLQSWVCDLQRAGDLPPGGGFSAFEGLHGSRW